VKVSFRKYFIVNFAHGNKVSSTTVQHRCMETVVVYVSFLIALNRLYDKLYTASFLDSATVDRNYASRAGPLDGRSVV
jgi:hypothetical protein